MKDLYEAVKSHGELSDDEIVEAGEHGADAGWPGFTYYADTCQFYDDNEDMLLDRLADDAEEYGYRSLAAFVDSWACATDIHGSDTWKNAVAWYALETVGRWLADNREAVADG